ncbi:rho guanine nucleotide exchange factor 7 isoform X2 [Eurytemora carolleeae]|uniref:rho guanine nucleotide exchange factor 7 isoform X2 n=1 Tax=Eurytemora carolleeae TaxID=1294199 RepID=UPI000C781EDE|nr:rho guanine nucleotide exchange factor 7 isoform X2 [Eurytemora carolleeae]XP_023336762.1 rho guanine nucleotide exchange factor 7 isoform X2 [Eurytemora carolleeae]XP_023336769.1 rho guanine nucleotide exchange factor 7 isoform X2 [Eurytemora carolleeae]|eukprot:XP_023336754.1 rho guanine nucleotide exchange factor 7-like isoform X2 [Eurytemora affinis]
MAVDPIKVRAIFKFKGTNNDELKFKKSDIITLTQKLEGGWWEGTLDGKTGWFPCNYVEEISEQNLTPTGDKDLPVPEEVLAKNIDYRQQVIRDLLEKEQEFVSDLRSLHNQFLQPLRHADILIDSEYNQLVGNIEELIEAHQRLNSSLEDVRRCQPRQQRLGQVFLQHGSNIRSTHLSYWSNHPRAVCILEKHREKLNSWLDACQGSTPGSSPPGLIILTTGLSRPFRQLERLAGAIQEVEQHLEDNHIDRGDTQRSIGYYKEVASEAARARRQRELELEVLTGTVREWEGEPIDQLGDIIKMGPVVVGPEGDRKDKYLVLFPSTLLLLSASHRLSAFIYEGKLPLSGLSITKPEEQENKNSFDISGSMIETIHCSTLQKPDCMDWIEKLQNQVRVCRQSAVLPTKLSVQPLPPPHKPGSSVSSSPAVSRSPRTGLASRGQGQGVQGWKMTCLRPAPPARSFFQADKRNTLRRKEVEQSSYEDDLQILRVIEAYCTSKQRQTITNSAMLDSTPFLSMVDDSEMEISSFSASTSVMSNRHDISRLDKLEREVLSLNRRLEQETQSRKKLQELIQEAGLNLPQDISIPE